METRLGFGPSCIIMGTALRCRLCARGGTGSCVGSDSRPLGDEAAGSVERKCFRSPRHRAGVASIALDPCDSAPQPVCSSGRSVKALPVIYALALQLAFNALLQVAFLQPRTRGPAGAVLTR